MSKKMFSIGQLLSVSTEVMAVEDFGDVYEILNYMTGDSLYTTELPFARDECEPYIREQHPWLNNISADDIAGAGCLEKVKALALIYGEQHEVRPIHKEDHEHLGPFESLKRLGFNGEVLGVEVPPEDDGPSDIGDINWK